MSPCVCVAKKEWREQQRQRILRTNASADGNGGGVLPYNGDVEQAQKAGDRDAIRAIFRARMIKEKATDKDVSQAQGVSSQYDVLGLQVGCTDSQVQTAYRRLALIFHPDKYKATTDKEHSPTNSGTIQIMSFFNKNTNNSTISASNTTASMGADEAAALFLQVVRARDTLATSDKRAGLSQPSFFLYSISYKFCECAVRYAQ